MTSVDCETEHRQMVCGLEVRQLACGIVDKRAGDVVPGFEFCAKNLSTTLNTAHCQRQHMHASTVLSMMKNRSLFLESRTVLCSIANTSYVARFITASCRENHNQSLETAPVVAYHGIPKTQLPCFNLVRKNGLWSLCGWLQETTEVSETPSSKPSSTVRHCISIEIGLARARVHAWERVEIIHTHSNSDLRSVILHHMSDVNRL
jgi:hypothetical protein